MKALKMIGLALMATFTGIPFNACTNDTEDALGQDTEIRLTSEITAPSRGTSLTQQSTQIVTGQQVGVTITGAKTTHNNIAWTAGTDGALTNTGSTLYYGTGEATIKAYHPHNSEWTGTSHTFSVSTDQSTDAGYLGSDLLWATKTASKTESPVALTFTHKLAKINVTLVPEEEGTSLTGATISICGTNIDTNINLSDGELSDATANVQEIKAGVTTNEAYTASAIIVPQTVAASTPFIKITLGEKTFYHKLSAEKTFVSGKSYSYTLTVKEKQVEVDTEGDIKDWENGDEGNTGDADEEDVSSYSNGVAHIAKAGDLPNVIGDEKLTITTLKITGELNGTDIKFLREMAGQNYAYQATNGQLTALDLSGATIVTGGDAYTYDPASDDSDDCYTSNNIIGKCMFSECSLESIVLPDNIIAISAYAFEDCTNLETVSIAESNSLNLISNQAFYNCSSLTSVDELLKNVTTIGEKAFYQCQGLSSVTIAEGTVSILESAFYNCQLNSITLPSTLEIIHMYAFKSNNSTGIETIRCKATTPPNLYSNVYNEYDNFNQTADNLVIYIPTGTLNAYEQADGWSQFAGKFVEE